MSEKLDAAMNRALAAYSTLEAEVDAMRTQVKQLEVEYAELEAENAKLRERIGFAHSCSDSCSRDLCVNRRLREENDSLSIQLGKTAKAASDLRIENERLKVNYKADKVISMQLHINVFENVLGKAEKAMIDMGHSASVCVNGPTPEGNYVCINCRIRTDAIAAIRKVHGR